MTASNIPLTRDIARKVLATVDAGLSPGLGSPIPGQMCVEAAVCFAYGLPHSDNPPCVAPVVRSLKIALNDKAWSSNAARAKGMRRIAIAQLGTADILDERLFISRIAEMTIRKVVPMALHAAASLFVEGASKDALEAAAALCEVEGTKDAAYAAVRAAYAAARAADAAVRAAARAAYAAADAAARAAYAAADAAYAAVRAADAAARAADAADAAYVADAAARAADAADAAYVAASDKTLGDFAEGVVQILVELGAPGTEFLDMAPLD